MKLFIDTADVAQIREAYSWGIVDGVTTNPTHVMKSGRKPDDVYREILDIVDGPVSLETIATGAPSIVKEGRALAKLHKNVVVKVPVIREGLKAVKELSADGIKTQILTAAVRHPGHVLESALAGADACTMFFDFIKMLYDHPLTDSGLDTFL